MKTRVPRNLRSLQPVALLSLLASVACSAPPYQGPPPEYEAPRPFPSGTPSATPEAAAEEDEPPPYGTPEALATNVDRYMSGFGAKWGESYAPSGVLLIAQDGHPVVTRTYGKADREKGTAFTADTRLRIGSVTKQFTATAVMELVERGKVKTSDPIRQWVKELPDSFQNVTILHLLDQNSGIPSYTDDPAWLARKSEEIPQSEILGWLSKQSLDFAAGGRWAYSNSNYYLLGLVIERAMTMPLPKAMDELVFKPAALTATNTDGTNAAIGYTRAANGTLKQAEAVSNSLPGGAGFLYSSANDMLRWDAALYGQAVLDSTTQTVMANTMVPCPDCGGAYGYGWIEGKLGGHPYSWHNGMIDGFNSYFARSPETGITIVLLCNTTEFDATSAGTALSRMALTGDPVTPVVERDIVVIDENYAGTLTGEYVLTKESKEALATKLPAPALESIEGMDMKWEEGVLTFKPVGQGRFSLRKTPTGQLFNSELHVDFEPDFGDAKKPAKKAKGVTLKQGGLVANYVRGKLPKKKAPKTPQPAKTAAKKAG